jgi:hypothetical protein
MSQKKLPILFRLSYFLKSLLKIKSFSFFFFLYFRVHLPVCIYIYILIANIILFWKMPRKEKNWLVFNKISVKLTKKNNNFLRFYFIQINRKWQENKLIKNNTAKRYRALSVTFEILVIRGMNKIVPALEVWETR